MHKDSKYLRCYYETIAIVFTVQTAILANTVACTRRESEGGGWA